MKLILNTAEVKAINLKKAQSILTKKGLTMLNIGISDKIKINTLCVDYSLELKAKVTDIVENIGISERAAITLLLEVEIMKIKIDSTIAAAENSTISLVGKHKIVSEIKNDMAAPVVFIVKTSKLPKIDEVLKDKVNDTAKVVCHAKSLIYPQIIISDICIRFANLHEITGVLQVAEVRAKAKKLMEKTGITSERIVLVYMFEEQLTYIPKAKVSDKAFTLKIGKSSVSIVIDEEHRLTFHQNLDNNKLQNLAFQLQMKIVSLLNSSCVGLHDSLKKISDYLNNQEITTFKSSITLLENFTY